MVALIMMFRAVELRGHGHSCHHVMVLEYGCVARLFSGSHEYSLPSLHSLLLHQFSAVVSHVFLSICVDSLAGAVSWVPDDFATAL
jgi:hypothetical protein